MTKYQPPEHYRGAPESVNDAPMDQGSPEEVEDHVQYTRPRHPARWPR